MWLWCAAAPCRCHTGLLIDWWWVLCKDIFVKAESDVCCSMPNSSPCLVWDFFGLFSGSGRYNDHIMPLQMGQNICQEWSRLITGPVTVGGPLVTQCSAEILKRKLLKEHLRIYLFVLLLSLPCVLFGVILIWAYLCVRVCESITVYNHHVPLRWNGSSEQCVWVSVCVRRQECRFHILSDNEIKDVTSERGIPVIFRPAKDL